MDHEEKMRLHAQHEQEAKDDRQHKEKVINEKFHQSREQAEYSMELCLASLIRLAKQGDAQALSSLLSIARDTTWFLAGGSLNGEAKANLEKLQRDNMEWPVLLSCEHSNHEEEIASFKQLPLGENLPIKHNKIGKRGRPIDWRPEGNADVARNLVLFIHAMKSRMSQSQGVSPDLLIAEKRYKHLAAKSPSITSEEMELQCKLISLRDNAINENSPTIDDWAEFFDLPEDLTLHIKNLPDFVKTNLKEWSEVACKLALDTGQQDRWIPSSWRKNYGNQAHVDRKGYGAYCQEKIISPLKSMVQAGD